MFASLRHHHHRRTFFLGVAAAALLFAQAAFIYKAFAQLLTDTTPLTAAIVLPAPNTVITSGEVVLLKASVIGATQGTTVGFLVSGPGTPRTFSGVATSTTIVAPNGVLYEAAMPISAADNGAYTVKAIVNDAATGRNAQTDSLPFSIAFPTSLTQDLPTIALTAPSSGTRTIPFDLRAETSSSVAELHFEFFPTGATTGLPYAATPSSDGRVWEGVVDAAHPLPVGTYDLRAVAMVGTTKIESPSRSITIGTATSTDTTTDTGTGTTDTDTTDTVPFAILRVVPEPGHTFTSGPITIRAVTNLPAGNVSATITGASFSLSLPALTPASDGMTWEAAWPAEDAPNGTYTVTFRAEREGVVQTHATTLTLQRTVAGTTDNTTGTNTEPTEEPTTEPTPTTETVPVTPFTVTFVAPAAGSTVSGIVTTAIRTSVTAKSVEGYVSGASATATPTTIKLSPSYDAGKEQWIATWKTDGLSAGDYRISVLATHSDGRTADAVITVKVAAPVVAVEPTPVEPVRPISVVITEPINATIMGTVRLGATTDGSPDAVTFLIRSSAPGSTEIARKASLVGSSQWSTTITEGTLTPGSYMMVATATKSGVTSTSASVQFTIASPVTTPVVEQLPEAERPLVVTLIAPNGGTIRGVARFAAGTNVVAGSVRFLVIADGTGAEVAAFDAAYQQETASWVAIWNTTVVPDGTYRVVASATRSGQSAKSAMVAFGIANTSGEMRLQTEVPVEAVRQAVLELPSGTTALDATRPAETPEPGAAEDAAKNITDDCAERGIPGDKCQDWLAGQPQAQECRFVGITTVEECLNWLRKQAGGELLECRGLSDEQCAEAEQRKTAGLLSSEDLDWIDATITDHLNTVITLRSDAETGRAEAVSVDAPEKPVGNEFASIIPLRPGEDGLPLRVHASPAFVQTSETESARRVPAVLLIDTDEDGLPDDVEKRLETDPSDADSDDDGFDDGMEIQNGFDPLGTGKLKADHPPIAPIDAAIIAGLPIEQPTEAGDVSEGLGIDSVGSGEEQEGIRFEGIGTPGEVVSIFVYSYLPVILSTTVGEDGTWAYDLDDTLSDGKHEAYVTVTDSTGQIAKKGNPLSFFVAEAKAATEEEYFGANADLVAVAEAPVTDLYRFYTIGAVALILIAAILGVMIFRQPRRDIPLQ